MEITKMLTVSSGHISKETAELLGAELIDIIIYDKNGYGWFIFVPSYKDAESYIPRDLHNLLVIAEDNGCEWLCLDCDGEVLDGFETYEL